MEWGAVTLRYTGDLTLGTGQPGVASGRFQLDRAGFATSDFVVVPRGPVALQERQVSTHQISVILPLRNGN